MGEGGNGALLERESELRELERVVAEAASGDGRLILIEGPAGIGKTRLLDAVRTRAREHGMTVLTARASELDRAFPFGVVRQLLEPLLASGDEERRETLLRGAAGRAAPLLAEGPPDVEDGTTGARQSLEHFHSLYWLTANLAEEAPVALVIDDVHWADAGSQSFLEFLVPRLEGQPVLVALAARPAEPGARREAIDAVATDALATVVRPDPLSERAVGALIEDELGEAPEPRFGAACHEASGGNPFLLRELLRELVAGGVEPSAASVSHVRQLAPPTVARAVLLRLARLGDEASALARAVAVLGDGTPLRRASALADLPEESAGEHANALAQAGILTSDRPLAYAHPILRSAVYGDIDAGARAGAHRQAAALLADEAAPADEVAAHLLATEPAGDPYVVSTLDEAARRALARGAASVAVDCLRRALAEPPHAPDRGRLTLRMAEAELHAGDSAAAADHFDEGVRITADPLSRAACAWDHAVALQAAGRGDDAWALRERAIDEVADVDGELALSLEASLIASAFFDRSRAGWARERLERYRGRVSGSTPAGARLLATQAIIDGLSGDEPADAVADTAESALSSGSLAAQTSGYVPFFCAIEALWCADRIEPARRALDREVERVRRRGSVLGFASMSGWRCMLLARQGELKEAEADARSCAELALPNGWFGIAPPMLGHVLHVLLERGELDDAERVLDGSGLAERARGDDFTFHPMIHTRARLRAARGDVAGGRAAFEAIRRRPGRWNTYMPLTPAVLVAPELITDPGEERERAERMLHEARAWGTARAIGMALRALGLLESGERGLELLEESAAVLESSPARLEHARAVTDFGAALRRANRPADARAPLRRALDLADACGAAPLAERARSELRAAGGRPRRARLTGAESLTASERRIAGMAAEGLSNPEIAQALFVTKKTVEAHLSSTYGKLGIRSRGELARALDQRPGRERQ